MLNAKRVTIAVLLIGLVGGLLFWFGRGEAPEVAEDSSDDADADRAALLERKKAAREGKKLDLRPCSVSGRVIEEGGGGIAGAVVRLAQDDDVRPEPTGEIAAPVFAVTDAKGEWSIEAVRPGTYAISATAREHVPGFVDAVALAPAKAHDGVELVLAPGGLALTGTVTDYGGGPVEGVLVSASSHAPRPGPESIHPRYAALSGAEGHYELWLADRSHTVSTWHPDYASESDHVSMKGEAKTLDFELIPGAVVEGTVIDTAGKPVGDAKVVLAGRGGGRRFGRFDGGEVQTGADGKFGFRQLRAGVAEIRAFAPGLATVAPPEIQLAIGEQVAGVEVVVEKAVDVSGFVVRQDDPEQGVANAEVGIFSMREGGQYVSGPSEDDGYFVIHGVAPGTYMASAEGDGILGDFLSGMQITVEDEPLDDVLVEVEYGVEISGRVEPPMAVGVAVKSLEEETGLAQMRRMFRGGQSYSSEDGTFRILGAEKGEWKLVATAAEGDGKGELVVEVPAEGLQDVVISLDILPRVSGRVVDRDGNPLSNLRVSLEDQSKSPGRRRGRGIFINGSGPGSRTAKDGSFEILRVEDAEYAVKVLADNEPIELEGADPETKGIPLSIQNGVGVDGLQLRALTRRGRITGSVTAAGGGPAADVWVTASRKTEGGRGWSWDDKPALTDVDGRFELDELEEGRYELSAEAADKSARGKLDDVGLGDDVVIALEAPARITGTVRHAGAPVTDFMLDHQTSRFGGFGGKRVVSEQGAFELERLDPGRHAVVVTTDDGSARATVELAAGEDEHVELEIAGWAKVTGTAISAETGEPLEGLMVMAFSSGGSKKGDVELFDLLEGGGKKTGSDGGFELDGLGEGVVSVRFATGDLMDSNELGGTEAYVESGQTVDLGRIRLLEGEAVPEDERGDLGLWASPAYDRPSDDEPRGPIPNGKPEAELRLWVVRVHPDGPAAKAGIEKHAEILAVDGKTVEEYGPGLPNALLGESRLKKGQAVKLTLEGGKNVTVVAD